MEGEKFHCSVMIVLESSWITSRIKSGVRATETAVSGSLCMMSEFVRHFVVFSPRPDYFNSLYFAKICRRHNGHSDNMGIVRHFLDQPSGKIFAVLLCYSEIPTRMVGTRDDNAPYPVREFTH